MKPNVIIEAEELLPQIDAGFQRGAYILCPLTPYLSPTLRDLVSVISSDGMIACYAPVMDILAKSSLPYERPAGRSFAMWLDIYPSHEVTMAAAIHEGAHYLCDRHPSRDEPNEEKAIRDWWGSWQGDAHSHDRNWLAAVIHLWHRSCRAGYEIPLAMFDLEQYGYGEPDALLPLLDEASQREGEPIESILASGAQASTTKRRRRFPYVDIIGGQAVTLHADGSLETFVDLNDKRGARKYQSVRDFYTAQEIASRQRVPLYL